MRGIKERKQKGRIKKVERDTKWGNPLIIEKEKYEDERVRGSVIEDKGKIKERLKSRWVTREKVGKKDGYFLCPFSKRPSTWASGHPLP